MALLHKPRHVPLIFVTREKTETRRIWDDEKNRPRVGSVHIITTEYYQRREEAAGWVRILDVYQEPLGAMTEEDFEAEGGYTEEEFKAVWRDINGEWDPEQIVDVVEYEPILASYQLKNARRAALNLMHLIWNPKVPLEYLRSLR